MTGLLTACEVTSLGVQLSGVGAGDYYIGSIVDVTDIVLEQAETNNTLATPGRITLLPVGTGP